MKYITNFIYSVVIAFLALSLLALFSRAVNAKENWFIQVYELDLIYRKYQPSGRHPLFYASKMKEGIDLDMNTDLAFGLLFWDNKVHSMTNQSQYYLIGWQFKFGAHVLPFLDVQYEHHSQHILDDTYPSMKFPVEDSLGFTLRIMSDRSKRGMSIF